MKSYLKEKFNVKYPIIQGGMANIATPEFASCVANNGAIGLIGTGGWDIEYSKMQIDKMSSLVNEGAVWGVNVMLMNPYAPDIINYCIEKKVSLITTGAGNPGKYVDLLHENNIVCIPVVPSANLAIKMEKYGVDAVIIEGTESGGHVGEMTTMTLLPQVKAAVNIPVIAAGGIASAEQHLATIILGADGIQIGTVLLATKECPVHDNYKQLILSSKDNSTIVTGRKKGVPVRSIKNKMARKYARMENSEQDSHELEKMTLGSLRKAVLEGNIDEGSFMAGQVVGQINEIKSVKEVLEEIANFDEIIQKLK